MNTKFKVGDKVRVKSLEWYNLNKDNNGRVFSFSNEMAKFCGQLVTISSVFPFCYTVKEYDTRFNVWYDWMFEDKAIEEDTFTKEMLVSNDKKKWVKRLILMESSRGFISINKSSERRFKNNKGFHCVFWKYAKEIEQQESKQEFDPDCLMNIASAEPVQVLIKERFTGKTTRVIDKAIQDLYQYGKLAVPKNKALEDVDFVFKDKTMTAMDPDWRSSPFIQVDLFHRILKRLQSEHPNQYVVSGINSKCPVIKLVKK